MTAGGKTPLDCLSPCFRRLALTGNTAKARRGPAPRRSAPRYWCAFRLIGTSGSVGYDSGRISSRVRAGAGSGLLCRGGIQRADRSLGDVVRSPPAAQDGNGNGAPAEIEGFVAAPHVDVEVPALHLR